MARKIRKQEAGNGVKRVKNEPETSATAASASRTSSSPTSNSQNLEDSMDVVTVNGIFGWIPVDSYYLPYIVRLVNGESLNFVSVRMAECQMLSTFLRFLHPDIFDKCISVKSDIITENEAEILNDINKFHCDKIYGHDKFVEGRDFIVRLEDAKEFYLFAEMCYKRLISKIFPEPEDKCGFLRIGSKEIVPFSVKDNIKYFPLFYFEGEIDFLQSQAIKIENWELAYLKFCCKVQGVRPDLFSSNSCFVISYEIIKSCYPPNTKFEYYWPPKVDMEFLVLTISNHVYQSGAWIKKPVTLGIESISTSGNVQNSSLHPSSASIQVPSVSTNNNFYQNGWPSNQLNSSISQQRTSYNTNIQPSYSVQNNTVGRTHIVNNTLSYSNMNSAQSSSQSVTAKYQAMTSSNVRHRKVQVQQGQQKQWCMIRMQVNSTQRLGNTQQQNALRTNMTAPEILDTIDLSTPPSSPEPSAILPSQDTIEHYTKIVQIPERPSPYKVRRVLIHGEMMNCINSTEFNYTDWMITLNEFVQIMFPTVTVKKCAFVLNNYLNVILFKGNSEQVALLMRKCSLGSVQIDEILLAKMMDVHKVYVPLKDLLYKPRTEIATLQITN